LDLNPELPEAYKALGIIHSLEGQQRRALSAYQRALELRPDYREAENNMAFLRPQLGQWDEAGRWQPRRGTRLLE
jgi:tetratricopeptide (TPR) repeat protein